MNTKGACIIGALCVLGWLGPAGCSDSLETGEGAGGTLESDLGTEGSLSAEGGEDPTATTDQPDDGTLTTDPDEDRLREEGEGDTPGEESEDARAEEVERIEGFVRFAEPADGATISGTTRIVLEPVGFEELRVEVVDVTIGDTIIFHDLKLPTDFHLDTRSVEGTSLTLDVIAKTGISEASDSITVQIENPALSIDEVTPSLLYLSNGERVTLTVKTSASDAEVGADFSAMDTGFDPSMVTVTGAEGSYEVSYTLSADNLALDGRYTVPVSVSAEGETVSHTLLQLDLRNEPVIPFAIPGGVFVSEPLPLPSSTWMGSAPSVAGGNTHIVTGGSAKVAVEFYNQPFTSEISGLIVGLENHSGYYQLPLYGSTGFEEVLMVLRTFLEDETPPLVLPIRFALRDVRGRVSPYVGHMMTVQAVGGGDVQVSVSFDQDVDIDLHVIEPNTSGQADDYCAPAGGCELYYGDKSCPSGGQLDLDSNVACIIDGINNENIFWPEGQAPIGNYTVRVAFWSDCCNCGSNYTVTIQYCGFVEVYEGYFLPNTDTGGGAGAGITVAEFDNCNCGKRVIGDARYRDQTFDAGGISARMMRPIRHAKVNVYQVNGEPDAPGGDEDPADTLIGQTTTDRNGHYEVNYAAGGEGQLYVEILSETNPEDGLRDIAVADNPKFGNVYTIRSALFETPTEDANITYSEMDFELIDDLQAGAFNIFDVLITGHDRVTLMTGRDLGEVRGYWMTGFDSTDTLYCSQTAYNAGTCNELGALSVRGNNIDRDEWDDMVILRELFKLATERVSRDDSPSGQSDGTRSDVRRAWTDGLSTFFACDAMDTRYFVNTTPRDGYMLYDIRDLEVMDTPWAFRTSNGAMNGDLSDSLVSAFLWDLADSTTTEVWDGIHGARAGIYDVLFTYFNMGSWVDRGVSGVDLVEFLDGWFCRGWKKTSAIEDLLVNHRQFNYDFDGPLACSSE
uniref:Uncharacterized protein n=2 Tax=environmental samples TaxID=48479 RepID=C7FPK4_9BACT|nr:hypothetical protein [uncultured bacterium HF186_25m_18N5]ACU26507.1 hypothetical protein [uncultured bacterium HF186_25m_27D22]